MSNEYKTIPDEQMNANIKWACFISILARNYIYSSSTEYIYE